MGPLGRDGSKWAELSDRGCYWFPNITVRKARLAIPVFRMFLKSEFGGAVLAIHNGSCVSSVLSWKMELQRRPAWQYSALCPRVRKWLWIQPFAATHSFNISAGVLCPKVFLSCSFNFSQSSPATVAMPQQKILVEGRAGATVAIAAQPQETT